MAVPELPEVENVRRDIAPLVVGRRVVEAGSFDSPKFAPATEVTGATFTGVARRGKYLLFGLDDGRELVVHLGMTGLLRLRPSPSACDAYVRAWWAFDGGGVFELRDVRRFGRVAVVPGGDYRSLATLRDLGPEPFDPDFDGERLWRALRSSTRRVKTQLLSQRPVAGVGNIYADEALWEAGVNPARRSVTKAQAVALHRALVEVMAAAIDRGGTTLRDYRRPGGGTGENQHHLRCYGRAGSECLRCGATLVARSLDGRTSTFCRKCQR